jgi:hypothetical protein
LNTLADAKSVRGFTAENFEDQHVQRPLKQVRFFHKNVLSIGIRWECAASSIECQWETFAGNYRTTDGGISYAMAAQAILRFSIWVKV